MLKCVGGVYATKRVLVHFTEPPEDEEPEMKTASRASRDRRRVAVWPKVKCCAGRGYGGAKVNFDTLLAQSRWGLEVVGEVKCINNVPVLSRILDNRSENIRLTGSLSTQLQSRLRILYKSYFQLPRRVTSGSAEPELKETNPGW